MSLHRIIACTVLLGQAQWRNLVLAFCVGVIAPLLLLNLVLAWVTPTERGVAWAGAVVASALLVFLRQIPEMIALDAHFGRLQRLFTTGVSSGDYVAARLALTAPLSAAPLVVAFAGATVFDLPCPTEHQVFSILLICGVSAATGLPIGLCCRDITQQLFVINVTALACLMIFPVLYPIGRLASEIQPIAAFAPPTVAVHELAFPSAQPARFIVVAIAAAAASTLLARARVKILCMHSR